MKNRCIIRKYAAILALSVMAVLFLPESLSAQGAVVAYAHPVGPKAGYSLNNFPSDDQLNRLTHVIVTAIGVNTNGTLKFQSNDLPSTWNGNKNTWLQGLVGRAHAKGVKVCISIGGGLEFNAATNSTQKLSDFVGEIATFVNNHSLDGVDINWEYPQNLTEWNRCINLLDALQNSPLLLYKRISIALAGYPDNWKYTSLSVPQTIWGIADAIHLMTYDEGGWPAHSDFTGAKNLIDGWWENYGINWGMKKEKLFLGCAFYGYKSNTLTNANKVSYRDYVAGVAPWVNPGNFSADVTAKTDYCLDNGYGGVFAWELGYDVAATGTNPPSLLNAIWNARPTIFGPDLVCYARNDFHLFHAPAAPVSWSVTGPFTVALTNSWRNVTVTRTGTGTGNGTLTARINGTVVATKTITPCNPSITGNTNFCGNRPVTFTAGDWQPGFTWATSSNLAVTGNTASNSITVQVTSTPDWGWVAVMMGATEIVRKGFALTLEAPVISHIYSLEGVSAFHNYERPTFYAEFSNNPSHVTYDWYSSGQYLSPSGAAAMQIGFYPGETGPGFMHLIAYNVCGSDIAYSYFYVMPDPTLYSAYPNPASNILNIEIDAAAIARAQSSAPTITSGKQLKIDPDYDIRLYDNRGTLLRRQKTKGGKVEFSVADLPNGIYYLHIHDGVSSKPEMRQIVVEH